MSAVASEQGRGPSDDASAKKEGIGSVVASHYNKLEEKGVHHRKESRIYHMRNLNNWIKSQLVNEYIAKIRERKGHDYRIRVLDIGCGKGGDLLKWQRAGVSYVVCADIAATSVDQARSRYQDMRRRGNQGRIFDADFVVADCTKERLRDKYRDPSVRFDIVSCQFAFHYCFESLPQAECMLRNVSECLEVGGFFIGTTPDAYDIVRRLREGGEPAKDNGSGNNRTVGNSVYRVTSENFDSTSEDEGRIPLFGARYRFQLEGVVDCPEFLVHFPTLSKLADKRFGLLMVAKRRFANYFSQFSQSGMGLLGKMNALETFPPPHGSEAAAGRLAETEGESYEHARRFLRDLEAQDPGGRKSVGTLSKEEWEAATLYVIFAFKKMSEPANPGGGEGS